MKWTATSTVTLTALLRTTDLAHAKHIRHLRNRQLQFNPDNYYYPLDITKGICSNDPTTRPSSFTEIGVTLFETREECCDKWYSWQAGGNCRNNEQMGVPKEVDVVEPTEAPPTTTESTSSEITPDETVFFYPMDLITGKCSNDASQRPSDFDSIGFTLFFTLAECCSTW